MDLKARKPMFEQPHLARLQWLQPIVEKQKGKWMRAKGQSYFIILSVTLIVTSSVLGETLIGNKSIS